MGEGPACQSVAAQRVEVNTEFSLVESFGESRLVGCVRESLRVLTYHCRFVLWSGGPSGRVHVYGR